MIILYIVFLLLFIVGVVVGRELDFKIINQGNQSLKTLKIFFLIIFIPSLIGLVVLFTESEQSLWTVENVLDIFKIFAMIAPFDLGWLILAKVFAYSSTKTQSWFPGLPLQGL